MGRPSHRALIALVVLAGAARSDDASGLWLGALDAAGLKLRLALTLTRSAAGTLAGNLESIDQGLMNMPLEKVAARGGSLHFESKAFGAVYNGVRSGGEISGRWKQKEGTVPLLFRRVERFRPQDPVKPYPYAAEEVTFENRKAGVRFAGTLTIPREPRPAPAVLLISGSGPEDRDAATAGHRPFWILADALTRRGVAVLRVDDRGVGGSTGRLDDAAIDDLAGDALAAVDLLKTRPEIDQRRIGLIGHSEGGLIAPLAATRSPHIAFLVMLAAPAIPGEELLVEQSFALAVSMGVPAAIAARHRDLHRAVFEILRQEPGDAAAREKIGERVSAMKDGLPEELIHRLNAQIGRLTSASFRAFLAYDPRPVLARIQVPVLVVAGDLDPLVPPARNLPEFARALQGDYRIVKLPGLNHLLQPAQTGSPMEYAGIEETIAPVAIEVIGDWVAHLAP